MPLPIIESQCGARARRTRGSRSCVPQATRHMSHDHMRHVPYMIYAIRRIRRHIRILRPGMPLRYAVMTDVTGSAASRFAFAFARTADEVDDCRLDDVRITTSPAPQQAAAVSVSRRVVRRPPRPKPSDSDYCVAYVRRRRAARASLPRPTAKFPDSSIITLQIYQLLVQRAIIYRAY